MKRPQRRTHSTAEVRQRARELRTQMTPAEELLWSRLRNRQRGGLKFRRQHPIGPFIVDFYCHAHRLVLEIEGPVHRFQKDRDLARTRYLDDRGYRVVTFSNEDVLDNLQAVLESVEAACRTPSPHNPATDSAG